MGIFIGWQCSFVRLGFCCYFYYVKRFWTIGNKRSINIVYYYYIIINRSVKTLRLSLVCELLNLGIVNGGDWLWSAAKIKGANKDATIYVRRSTTLHNLLFCVHTLCMNYVTSTFLLVSSSVRSKQLLCFVQGQGQKREQKHTTKNFVGFHNHSLY